MDGAETCSIHQIDVQMLIRLAVVKTAAADIANVGATPGIKPRELITSIVLGIFNPNNPKCTQCESQGLDCVPPKTASLKLVSSVTEDGSRSGFKRRKKQFSFGEDHRWIDVPKQSACMILCQKRSF